MSTILRPFLGMVGGFFRSRALLHMEVLALRQQLAMVIEKNGKRLRFHRRDRLFWVLLYPLWPECLQALHVFKADTLVPWHRKGFRHYWTCKSHRRHSGRAGSP